MQGLRFKAGALSLGSRVSGLGFRGFEFRVQGLGFWAEESAKIIPLGLRNLENLIPFQPSIAMQ